MPEYIKFLLIVCVGFSIGYHSSSVRSNSEIEKCVNSKVELDSIIANLTLQIQSANEVYDLLEDKNRLIRFRDKTIKGEKQLSEEKDRLIEDLMIIRNEYESKKISLDSLKQDLPNREGENLIKSLKIKTNL